MAGEQTKQQMMKAKKLIDRGRYADARKILIKIDHPTAKRWITKIDEMKPPKRTGSSRRWLLIAVIITFVIVGALIAVNSAQQRQIVQDAQATFVHSLELTRQP